MLTKQLHHLHLWSIDNHTNIMTTVRKHPQRRRNGRKSTVLFITASMSLVLILVLTMLCHSMLSSSTVDGNDVGNLVHTHADIHAHLPYRNRHATRKEKMDKVGCVKDSDRGKSESNEFVPTLNGKKILMEVTTVGQFQYAYFENVLDSVRDLCEAGARVDFHITTSNCDPKPKEGAPNCALYDQDRAETLENNYPVEKIDQLNERMRCRNPQGSLDVSIHLVSPDWGKQVVDNHRRIFYDNIDEGYDVFVHSEEDENIRPTNILSFMDEMEKLRKLVGDERISDYSIGFVRYENQMGHFSKRRVVWEFAWENEVETTIDHPGIEGRYFTSPGWHHQGMFMATKQQLVAWKTRGPECLFDKPVRRHGYHRERTSGAMDLYDRDFCNVTQLIPLDSMEDFYIHHMPDKNNRRQPDKVMPTMDLHKRRMKKLLENDPSTKLWVDEDGEYNGIEMFIDEKKEDYFLPFDLTSYNEYVDRGGMLAEHELQEWEWSEPQ